MKNILPIAIGVLLALCVFLITAWYFNFTDGYIPMESPIKISEAIKVKFKKFESPTNLAAFDEFRKGFSDKSGTYGIYIKNLKTGQEYKYNENELFYGASLYKIPIATLTIRQVYGVSMLDTLDTEGTEDVEVIKNGDQEPTKKLKFTDEVVYTESDFADGSGSIAESDFGTVYTIRELLDKLLKESDNVAQVMLIRTLGEDLLENEFARLVPDPVNSKYYNENETSPSEISAVLEKAYYDTSEGIENIFNIMTETIFDIYINEGLNEDSIFSHKIGSYGENGIWHDCGIILGRSPTVVCIMSQDANKEEFIEMSKLTGEFAEEYAVF
jgi:beta-lactamase class A